MFTFTKASYHLDDNECPIEEYKITTDLGCTIDATVGAGTKFNPIYDINSDLTGLEIDISLMFSDQIYLCAITKGLQIS